MQVRLDQAFLVLILMLLPLPAASQELEPRSFMNIPIGQTFLGLLAVRSEGDLSPTPSSILQDAQLQIDAGAIALSRTFELAGDAAKIDMALSRLCYEGTATFKGESAEGRRCEYGDPRIKLTWNFYGAPALRLAEFGKRKQGLVIGSSVALGVPSGTYNSEHLINAGTNRWSVKPSLGMSTRVGRWQWEAKAGATFFEDNDDFFNGILLEQETLYSVSAHMIYNLSKGGWASLDANYFFGGETSKDGVAAGDRQNNSRWGVTWSKPLTRHQLIKLYASTGVLTRVGNNFDSYGIGWLYRF